MRVLVIYYAIIWHPYMTMRRVGTTEQGLHSASPLNCRVRQDTLWKSGPTILPRFSPDVASTVAEGVTHAKRKGQDGLHEIGVYIKL